MATLEGKDFKTGSKSFSLTPVAMAGQDATEYIVSLWHNLGSGLQTYTFSVAGWQMGQDDVWVVARAFAESPALLGASLPVDFWRTGRQQKAYLCASATWLEVSISGSPRQQIRIVLYIEEGINVETYRRVFIQTDMNEARRFGLDLEREIIEASPKWALERGLRPELFG